MTAPQLLLLVVWGWPTACALLSVVIRRPAVLLPFSALPGLACALLAPAGSTLPLPPLLLGAVLRVDAVGAVFLGLCALLWTLAGLYALAYVGRRPRERSFCIFWQLTLAGSLGVCIAADAASFYLAFAALSLAAWVLVIHDRKPAALRAGRIYIALAIFGEVALLLGLVIAARAAGLRSWITSTHAASDSAANAR